MRVRIHITPREGVLDPQGKAIERALHTLGFTGVSNVRQGKYIELDTEEADAEAATESVTAMCDQLLANPVIEDYRIDIES